MKLFGTRFVFVLAAGSMLATVPAWAERAATTTQPAAAPAPQTYMIGPGDVLEVNVWKEPEASVPTAMVRPDGMISLPLIKEVHAAGHTPTSLQAEITERLSKLIRDADVTVVVKESRSEKAYVLGAVRKEGAVAIATRMTVLEAIAEAGGLTDYAKRGKIYILRQAANGQTRIPFDYSSVIRGQHVDQNVVLQRGDTIVVP